MEAEDLAIRFIGYDLLSTIAHQIGDALSGLARSTEAESGTMAAAFQGVGTALMGIGTVMTIVGVGLVGALTAAAVHAAHFDSDMVMVHTHAGLAADQIQRVSNDLINMAPAVGFGPDALAQAFYHVQSAVTSLPARLRDVSGEESILYAAAQLAAIGHADLTDTTNVLISVLNSYGTTNMTAADAASQLNAIVGNGNVTIQQFADAMRNGLLPVSAMAGVHLNSLGAAYGTLTDLGFGASQSATYLRSAIIQMTMPSGPATTALESLGLAGKDVMTQTGNWSIALEKAGVNQTEVAAKLRSSGSFYEVLKMLQDRMIANGLTAGQSAAIINRAFGGVRSGSGITGLADNLNSVALKEGLITNSTKEWSDTWQYFVQHDPEFAIKQLHSTLDAITTAFGQAFIPVLVYALAVTKPYILAILQWVEHNQKLVGFIGVAVAAFLLIGGVIFMVAGAFLYFGAVVVPFLAAFNPLTLAIVAAVILLASHWKELSGVVKPVVAAFNAFMDSMGRGSTAGQALIQALTRLGVPITQAVAAGNLLDKAITVVEGAFKRIIPAVIAAGNAIFKSIPPGELKGLWDGFVQLAAAIGQILVPVIGFLVIIIGSVLAGVFQGLALALTAILPGAILFFTGAFEFLAGVLNFIVALVSGVWTIFDDIFHGRFGKLTGDFLVMWQHLSDASQQITKGLTDAIMGLLLALVGGVIGLVAGFIKGFIGAFQFLYDTLVGHSIIPDLVNGIIQYLLMLPSQALGVITSFVNLAVNAFNSLAAGAASAGRNAIQGFINGMGSMIGAVEATASNLASSALGALQNMLGIHSPSVVMAQEVGVPIAQGIAAGIVATSAPQDALHTLTASITGPVDRNPYAGSSSGSGGDKVVDLLQKILDALTEQGEQQSGGNASNQGGPPPPAGAAAESVLYAIQERVYSARRRGQRGQFVLR